MVVVLLKLTGNVASMQDRETVVMPRRADHISSAVRARLTIVKVMEFTSQTLRSGVVVLSDDAPKGLALLFLRGAPAIIRDLVQAASVPPNFNEVSYEPLAVHLPSCIFCLPLLAICL